MTEYILSATMLSIAALVLFLIKDLKTKSHKHSHNNK